MKRLTVPITNKIQIKRAINLYIRIWEKSEIEFRYRGELEQELEDDLLSVSCNSKLLVSIPENVSVIVDKIEGNCKVFGELGNISIDKVTGNFEIESIKSAKVRSIGGNCKIGTVVSSIEIEKISGNCYLDQCHGMIKFGKIYGNFHGNGENSQIECNVGGNCFLQIKSFSGPDNKISAGGNMKLNIGESDDVSFSGSSGNRYNLDVGGEQLKGRSGKFNKIIGAGQKNVILSAGGKLQISDQEELVESNVELNGENEKLWNDLETEVDQSLSDLNDKLEKLKKFGEFSESSDFDNDFSEIMNNKKTSKVSEPEYGHQKQHSISEKEKMIVLKMLQEKKITAEEADRLLQALDQ